MTFVSEEDYALLPKVFHFNDTEKCAEDSLFCKINIRLKPKDETNPPRIWKIIEQVNNGDHRFYRRDIVYRGICTKNNVFKNEYNESVGEGLIGFVEDSFCYGKEKFSDYFSTIDILIWMALICYVIFVLYCTIKTYKSSRSEQNNSDQNEIVPANPYLKVFSIINTWNNIIKLTRNEDFDNLRSFQGIRTIAMIVVISTHNFMALLGTFSHNPEYVENLYINPFLRIFVSSFGLIVHIFFVISAWLLAVQLHKTVKKNGKFTAKDLLILSFNRYFRLMPAVLIVSCIHSSSSLRLVTQLIHRSHVESEILRCRSNWWMNVLFIQNMGPLAARICSPNTWYVAADIQMYLMTAAFFYISQKLKIPMKYFFGASAAAAACIQAYIVLTTNYEIVFRFSPRLLPGEDSFGRPEVTYFYASLICNIPTYIIGFICGSIYFENKNKIIFDTFAKKVFLYAAFFGIPLLTLLLYSYRSCRAMELIMSICLRPVFSLGIAIGLLGMATKSGGYIKKFLEWKPLVFFGNCTYSVYLFHYALVFRRFAARSTMAKLDDFFFFGSLSVDVTESFAYGLFIYIILEYPCGQLQKMILPQISTKNEITKMKAS